MVPVSEYLEFTVDKFSFKVATDRFYNGDGAWAIAEGKRVRIGLADFPQQRSGDVAFAEIQPEGTILEYGEEFATIETIKVNLSLGSPAKGVVVEVNPDMEIRPELINQDPYGSGWLMVVEASDWEADRVRLMDAETYFEQMKKQAREEAG
jgi:glycine cleavage system H protein